MKKILLLITVMCIGTIAMAQNETEVKYIRNSLYMMKLDMIPENEEYKHAFEVMNNTFDSINFARRY